MPDFEIDDYELYRKVADWDGKRALNVDLSKCDEWTEETILSMTKNNVEMLERFKKNAALCNLDSKTRNGISKEEAKHAALVEASKKVAVVKDNMYFSVGGKWVASAKERAKLAYQALGQSNKFPELSDFILYSDESQKLEFDNFKTRFISVGSQFFDIESGEMVDEAPHEFRTYGINKDINYTPVKFDECKSMLMTTLMNAFGRENLKYALLNVAYNLCDNNTADRRALMFVGESRTGKGTLIKALKNIGICADKDLSSELSNNDDFFDMLSESIPVYPVVSADECENINWTTVKKLASDDSMGINRKGEKQVTVTVRGFIMFTANRVPRCALTGLKNKVVILNTDTTFKKSQDPDYWEKVEAEGYDEFISLLLTMAHTMVEHKWTPSEMPECVAKVNKELSSEFLYHDSFYEEWDKTSEDRVSVDDAYRAYLFYANPDIGSYEAITNAVAESRITPTSPPKGLSGVSRNNFVGDARVNGVKTVLVNGKRFMIGKAPIREGYEMPVMGVEEFA